MAALACKRRAGVSGRSGKIAEQSFKGRPISRPQLRETGADRAPLRCLHALLHSAAIAVRQKLAQWILDEYLYLIVVIICGVVAVVVSLFRLTMTNTVCLLL